MHYLINNKIVLYIISAVIPVFLTTLFKKPVNILKNEAGVFITKIFTYFLFISSLVLCYISFTKKSKFFIIYFLIISVILFFSTVFVSLSKTRVQTVKRCKLLKFKNKNINYIYDKQQIKYSDEEKYIVKTYKYYVKKDELIVITDIYPKRVKKTLKIYLKIMKIIGIISGILLIILFIPLLFSYLWTIIKFFF